MLNATSLDALLALLASGDYEIDTSDLPTYGGEAPADTAGIYSWDETRLLVQDGSGWRIVARAA